MTAVVSSDPPLVPTFRMQVSVEDGCVAVFVDGELDIATAPALAAQLAELAEVRWVVVDLGGVGFIDSHGLAPIAEARSTMRVRSGELTVRSLSRAALRLVSILGFADETALDVNNVDIERWLGLCRADPVTVASRPDGLDDKVFGQMLSAVAHPMTTASGVGGEVGRLVGLVRAAGWEPSVGLARLVWVGETVTRVVMPDLGVDERAEAWRGLAQVLPKTMALVAGVAIGRLQAEALTDRLTGLGNRRAFDRRLVGVLADAQRSGRAVWVAVLDLDGLKAINDRHGHSVGDDTLQQLAKALTAELRAGDSAYRVGGDEFMVLLTDTTNAEAFLARLRRLGVPAFSAGLAQFPDDGPDPIGVADRRLYRSRQYRGR